MNSDVDPRRARVHLAIRIATVAVALWLFITLLLMWWWDKEPAPFHVLQHTQQRAEAAGQRVVVGSATTATLIHIAEVLEDKRGGYIANDLLPPGLWLDNQPNWELGAVLQMRDMARALREEFSRSQTQSVEDAALRDAENYLAYKREKWWLPSFESGLASARERLQDYLLRLGDEREDNAQFYARADNLASYLALVEKRLGSLSQRLSASVGQPRLNTNLAGDPSATQSTAQPGETIVKTPWLKIDDVFYEARGSTWALLHFLRAIELDFAPVLRDKNALVSLQQIIRELEEAQAPMSSPFVLNGSKYGLFANHSLVMANYVSRANAALIDLRKLLASG